MADERDRPPTPGSTGSADEPLTFPARWRPPRLSTAAPPRPASPFAYTQSPVSYTPFSGGPGSVPGSSLNSPASPFFSAGSGGGYQLGRSHSVEVLTSSAPRSRVSTLHRLARPPTPSPQSPLFGSPLHSPLPGSASKPLYSPYHDPHYSKYAKPPRSPFRALAVVCLVVMLVGSAVLWWTVDVEKAEETGRILEGKKPKYVLYRILGNDLPPRHRVGQTYSNLQFILKHEPDFSDTEKWWLLNRIVDPQVEREIVDLLTRHRQKYVRVPFRDEEYVRRDFRLEDFPLPDYFRAREFLEHGHAARLRILDSSYHDKNQYVMNNNGGRNHAILHGRHAVRARWILPFDGNAFLTKRAWTEITRALEKHGERYKYLVVPMHRLLNNTRALDENFRPLAREEPQIVFREDAEEMYDVRMRYGRRSKLELLWRLGVLPATPYLSNSSTFPWELNPAWRLSPSAGRFLRAGFVLRLFSGRPEQEVATRRAASRRAYNRMLGVQSVIDGIDEGIVGRVLNAPEVEAADGEGPRRSKGWWVWEEEALRHARKVWERRGAAGVRKGRDGGVEKWVGRVLDAAKGEMEQSAAAGVTLRDFLDYVRPGARPGRQRATVAPPDGQGKPSYVDVSLVQPAALPRALRKVAVLALATELSGDEAYATAAATEVRRWILGQGMSIPPSVLTTARKGLEQRAPTAKQHLMGMCSGLPAFLDALRILGRDGRFTESEWAEVRGVLATLLRFLLASDISRELDLKSREWESVRGDAAIASLAGFLGDVRSWNRIITGARMRVGGSLGEDEGCVDAAPPPAGLAADAEGDGAEGSEGPSSISPPEGDDADAKPTVAQAQVAIVAPPPKSADTFLDAVEGKAHLLQWWIALARVFESGYGRFRMNEQDRAGWIDPTPPLGNLAPALWTLRTSHATCKNVSIAGATKAGLRVLAADVERVWGLWGMSPDQEIGAEEDAAVLTDESDDGLDAGHGGRPAADGAKGGFAARYGIEAAQVARQANEARRARLRLVRARLQFVAQVAARLDAAPPPRLSAGPGAAPAGEEPQPMVLPEDDMDIHDFAATNRLRLKLHDDEPSEDGSKWEELWTKTPIVAFNPDGGAVGSVMDLPFAWSLGIRD